MMKKSDASSSRLYRIGLTGGSGSGKGAVAGILREKGIPCLDTDALVHRLYEEENGSLPRILEREFGKEIMEGGKVDRAALREIVFSDRERLFRLNHIVHAAVREEIRRFFEREAEKETRIAAVDAPQLFEAGIESDFDLIVTVDAPAALRIERILKRDGISEKEAARRLQNQLSPEEYREKADWVICNTGDLAFLRAEVETLLKSITADGAFTEGDASCLRKRACGKDNQG